ncbi:site-specific recombinase [Aquabacterium lacunae]|uniref:site-specific recombinase n=1 Tax=Aquabacterium lacunae TaxID=2528630 RepID=UPI001FE01D1C|nr:site-specific recombinase [Aquabacterium lacunae]
MPVQASRAERHLWLIEVLRWARRGDGGAAWAYLLRQFEAQPALRAQVVQLLHATLHGLHLEGLLADHGFAPRAAFMNELGERLRRRLLPASPDTDDLGTLFELLFEPGPDGHWLQALGDDALQALGQLLAEAWHARDEPPHWREPLASAIELLATQVQSAGLSPELRVRLGLNSQEASRGFTQLGRTAQDLRELIEAGQPTHSPEVLQQVNALRALIDACEARAKGVHEHLQAWGISVDVVFQIDQISARCRRMEALLAWLLSPTPHREGRELVLGLLAETRQRRSLRALFTQHYALLARQVAERSAETGEHYITRDRAAYFDMLRRAAGGGLVIAGTTFMKFVAGAMGLSVFWAGFAAGANYALSFVLIHLLHWTVATKQPAMTAPAMAARLAQMDRHDRLSDEQVQGFVDEVAHLLRSQMAGIVGNLAVVIPVVLAVQALAQLALGHGLIGTVKAEHVLHDLTLLGPTLAFAAFTGTLLFASSLVAGWVENWFVWHRLDSALQWNPAARRWLGVARAARWAAWWRENISGLAANVSLGFMLGVVPALATFFGLPIEVRHVTLSTGQIAAALGTLGLQALQAPAFWWCVAAIPLTGLLNVGVSFVLALRVALRSRGVQVSERGRLLRALGRRLLRQPRQFLLPPSA